MNIIARKQHDSSHLTSFRNLGSSPPINRPLSQQYLKWPSISVPHKLQEEPLKRSACDYVLSQVRAALWTLISSKKINFGGRNIKFELEIVITLHRYY